MSGNKPLLLDTSFVMDWFEEAIRVYRRDIEKYEKGEFAPTRKIEFLVEAKHALSTTNIAKSEVFRKLFSEFTANRELCIKVWTDFVRRFFITELEVKEVDFNEVAELCLVTPLGKGSIPNLIQLQFAKKEDLPFATGDGAIRENYTKYYEKICTYIELRQAYDDEKSQQSS